MQSKYEYILVRYGELTTKGKNRREFINKLAKNIKTALKKFESLEYKITYDRIYIHLNNEDEQEIIPILQKIYGLYSFSLAKKVESDINTIVDAAYEIIKDEDENLTFKVLARRRFKAFPMSSDQINRAVATKILSNTNLKVDVKNYDLGVIIEVEEVYTYIMARVYPGAGGYPTGISSKAMMLLSGGIDSPVALANMQKRGIFVEAVHFASPPYTSEESLNKVIRLAEKLSLNQKHLRLFNVPFTKLQLAIYKHVDEPYAITIMRRMMFRIAEELAIKHKCLALITGESLGQVASQTVENISVINDVIKMPVFRPLIASDKIEIINQAKDLDTYDISIEPYDDACTIFTPKNPITKPKLSMCEYYESKFDFESLVSECVENTELIVIKYDDINKDADIF